MWLVANDWTAQRVNIAVTTESSIGWADPKKYLAGDSDPVTISLGSKNMGIWGWENIKVILI